MNPALNLIGFRGLVVTGSGSKTASAKQSSSSKQLDFSSLLQSKIQRNTEKSTKMEDSDASRAKPDTTAGKAADEAVSKAVESGPTSDPDKTGPPVSTSTEAGAKEGAKQQSVEARGVSETGSEPGDKLETELDNELTDAMNSDPGLKEILALLLQLMSLVENQANPDGGSADEAMTKIGGSDQSGQGDLRQLILANMMQGKAVDADSADPTKQAAFSQLKEFAKQLEALQSMLINDNSSPAPAVQGTPSQTAVLEKPVSQSDVTAGTKLEPTKVVSSLVERLEEVLQRLEAKGQENGNQTASKALNGDQSKGDQSKKVENLVRGILQMIKAAEVVNKTATPESAAPTVADSSAETDAAARPVPLSTATNNESLESGKDTGNQSASEQNGSSKGTAAESKVVVKLSAKEESSETELKTTSQTQPEQKPAAVLLNPDSGKLEQRLSDTSPMVQKNVETQPQQVLKPIIEGMRLVQRESRTEMSIQLQPESLGKLNLKVSVENGLVTAKLVAESQSVGRLIESSLGQLKQSLHDQGIRFDRIEVSVGDSSAQPDMGQQFSRQYQNQDGGNQASRVNYSGGIDSDWTYQPTESSNTIRSYSSESQYDFLA